MINVSRLSKCQIEGNLDEPLIVREGSHQIPQYPEWTPSNYTHDVPCDCNKHNRALISTYKYTYKIGPALSPGMLWSMCDPSVLLRLKDNSLRPRIFEVMRHIPLLYAKYSPNPD